MLLISITAVNIAKNQLSKQSFQQLEAVREIKGAAVQRYFENVRSQILNVAASQTVIDSMKSFSETFSTLTTEEEYSSSTIESMREELRSYYANEYGAKYLEATGTDANVPALLDNLPPTAVALQYHYIQSNENAIGEKHLLDRAGGLSAYHDFHAIYHNELRNFLEEFGYYDIFLVDDQSGDVVYSVYKELDYATSLSNGPYANSNFADVFREASELPLGDYAIQDYQPYSPSYDAPASFVASPIFDQGQRIGVLVFQLPLEPINEIMKDRAGMGESGESYLVGPDYLMRSDSYLDPENH